jgi:hypothetical protein
MKHLNDMSGVKRIGSLVVAVGMIALMTGCEEANVAIDNLLGKKPQVSSSQSDRPLTPQFVIPVKKREAGATAPPAAPSPAPAKATQPPPPAPALAKGKRSEPGRLAPTVPAGPAAPEDKSKFLPFVAKRDPFKAPTEILPTECPPSMPLCRFDPSQLKLVGVLQVAEGQFKGLVEDPDGRGYFITSGMQIGGATVTQVTNKNVVLRAAKTNQDILMPLFKGAHEPREF